MKTLWPIFSYYHALKERLLPRPFERIALQGRRALVGAEVGVFAGEHARLLLKNADVSRLYLVDAYRAYSDYGQDRLNQALETARRRLKPWSGRCAWFYTLSAQAANLVPNNLDFTYLDAAHDYNSIASDIIAWWPKIRIGGVLGGHDYANGLAERASFGVVRAVSQFAVAHDLDLKVELSDWWIEKP